MATRFSATDAREKAQLVKKTIDEEKRQKAKERAYIKAGWLEQRKKIISAALDGASKLTVNESALNNS